MKIGCVSLVDKPALTGVRVMVLPEYSAPAEIRMIVKENPNAIVAAAVEEQGQSRALLLHLGQNQIDYLKIGSDGRTHGTGRVPSPPVRMFGDLAIGVIVCMDVQHPALLNETVLKLKAAQSPHKLLCIPADMGAQWFSQPELMQAFEGVPVALCNHPTNHQDRRQSFIADSARIKRAEQIGKESIFADLNEL